MRNNFKVCIAFFYLFIKRNKNLVVGFASGRGGNNTAHWAPSHNGCNAFRGSFGYFWIA